MHSGTVAWEPFPWGDGEPDVARRMVSSHEASRAAERRLRLQALGNAVVPQLAMVPLARVLELESATGYRL